MIYKFSSRVRYSETDLDGKIKLHALMNYLQDCSTFQSEELGLGVEALHKLRRVWMLASWQVLVERWPEFLEEITVHTQATDHDQLFGHRNFFVTDAKGEMIVKAESLWIYVNMDTGHPEPLTEDLMIPYGYEEPLEMERAPRRIRLPKVFGVSGEPIVIREEHLDSNRHVNNAQYVRLAELALSEHIRPRQIRAEYKKEAYAGDVMIPTVYSEEEKISVALKSQEDEVFCIVEFTL